ncbi:hypothetical protein cce_2241 [Crocosphaera subtropica ATCC 51142]|uniref:Filamentous haemagglutinin FhaB/tRNA nuclease CdiA-like TPS domain-containing protein n=1 Tax=Crocosphaera subtropica (strain ATCC 51142 / BH68) TaxID=43989 RepID=B1WPM1_CROS5|nr:CHAT domain-containing protein [Crocosphaera subtropica]ACB51591.1 hypothetical protein cce_2241 [Crocosphaera subtropica ATCC 51142]
MKLIKITKYLVFMLIGLTEINHINPTLSQSITPANDGTGTIVNQEGNQFNIEGGSLSGDGTNLFHSLEKFGLNREQIANFLANPQIRNILTRIVGGDASIINGLITITGGNPNLFLMNPAGIVFGPNVQLNLPADFTAITATGMGFDNNYWFNAVGTNNYQLLIGDPSQFAFDLTQSGHIINTGNLTVAEGHNLTLIGNTIVNTGTLKAPGGNITISAIPGTNRIRISQPGSLISLEITAPRETNAELLNIKPQDLPTLLTEGSQTLDLNISTNNEQSIQLTENNANLPNTPATLVTSGTLDASSPSGVGGNVTLIGDRIAVINAQIDGSGNTGGGTIRVGGDYRGQTTIPTAQRTLINSGSTLRSDSMNQGNGGQVTVWSEEITGFYGNISSRGGNIAGNGGFVEVSGKQQLIFRGTVDTSAVNGDFGTLLLDPENILIKDGEGDSGTDGIDTFAGNNNGQIGQILRNDPPNNTIIFESELEGLSGNTNIILEAENDITIEDLSDDALTFQPGSGSIIFRANADAVAVGSFRMNSDDAIIAPGRDLTIERLGNGCRQMNSCQVTVGHIDTSFADGGGSVTLTAQGNTNDNVPIIEVETINTSSTNGTGGMINLETLATNGEIRGEVIIGGIPFDPDQIDQLTPDILNSAGTDNNSTITINGVAIEFMTPEPPVPPVPSAPPASSVPPAPSAPPASSVPPAPSASSVPPASSASSASSAPSAPSASPTTPKPPGLEFVVNLNNAYTETSELGQSPNETGLTTNLDSDRAMLRNIEQGFTIEFANHLGIEPVSPLNLEQTQTILQEGQTLTGLKPGLIYIFFRPQSPSIQNPDTQTLWRFQSSPQAAQPQQPNNQSSPEDQLELMLVTASGKVIRQPITDVTREQVLSTVADFQSTITNPRRPSAYGQPAQQLYQWFIQPLKTALDTAKIDTLIFIVEGGLRSVPLAALYDGSEFLIEQYNMGIMPSLALSDTRYQDMTQQQVLAMGASEFTQQNPLPAVPLELSVIADRLWQGDSFLNENFTLKQLQQAHQSGKFGIIHLATHANFETGTLDNSYIQFWQNQLTLDQFKEFNFGDPQIELLVLSACRTALGDREAELGFAGAAVLAQVKTVLGSLWEVSDEGTLALMTRFYEQLNQIPLKTKAIREAQLSLLRGDVYIKKGQLVTPDNRLSLPPQLAALGDQSLEHPYFWSGFTLIGSPW